MHILLTNDDGFYAPGLQTLYKVLSSNTEHQISIVAPEGQRSAVGHSITLFEPLFVNKHPLKDNKHGFSVRGTPSDCVKLAIQGELIPKPDLLISGINQGPNLGTDVFYSGTVSAAMEGALLGIPSLAVSLVSYENVDFIPSAQFMLEFIDKLLTIKLRGIINLNIPALPRDQWKGIKITKLGRAIYENVFESRMDPHGRIYYWQAGSLIFDTEVNTDLRALKENYVSITPMHYDLTDYQLLNQLNIMETKNQEI